MRLLVVAPSTFTTLYFGGEPYSGLCEVATGTPLKNFSWNATKPLRFIKRNITLPALTVDNIPLPTHSTRILPRTADADATRITSTVFFFKHPKWNFFRCKLPSLQFLQKFLAFSLGFIFGKNTVIPPRIFQTIKITHSPPWKENTILPTAGPPFDRKIFHPPKGAGASARSSFAGASKFGFPGQSRRLLSSKFQEGLEIPRGNPGGRQQKNLRNSSDKGMMFSLIFIVDSMSSDIICRSSEIFSYLKFGGSRDYKFRSMTVWKVLSCITLK